MPRRIQINEAVEIRELTREEDGAKIGTGEFGIFSTDKKEFLKLDGKPIALQADDILVLPNDHSFKTLNLTAHDAKDKPAKMNLLLIVENHGKSIELAGDYLAVMGNATVKTTQFELAGIDKHAFQDKQIAIDSTNSNIDLFLHPNLKGRQLTYGKDHKIIALQNGFGGRVDMVDTKSDPANPEKILTLDGNTGVETQDIACGRLMSLRIKTMESLKSVLNGNKDQKTSHDALSRLGVPEDVIETLGAGRYHYTMQKPLQNKSWPAVKEEEPKKPFDLPKALIPDGRKTQAGNNVDASPAQQVAADTPVTQQELDDIRTRMPRLENFNAEAAVMMERRLTTAGARITEADQNSVEKPEGLPAMLEKLVGRFT